MLCFGELLESQIRCAGDDGGCGGVGADAGGVCAVCCGDARQRQRDGSVFGGVEGFLGGDLCEDAGLEVWRNFLGDGGDFAGSEVMGRSVGDHERVVS